MDRSLFLVATIRPEELNHSVDRHVQPTLDRIPGPFRRAALDRPAGGAVDRPPAANMDRPAGRLTDAPPR